MHGGKSAFTLIELLVVIAIIAILAAILFPVFAQAKLSAKKAVDQSNFKQASLAIIMYEGDYDSTYPLSTFWNGQGGTFGNSYVWSSALCVQPYIKNLGIYDCPIDPNKSTNNAAYYGLPADRQPAFQSFQANAITPGYQMFVSAQYPQGVTAPQGLMPESLTFPPCKEGYQQAGTGGCASNVVTTDTQAPNPATIVLLAGGNNEFYGNYWGCGPWIQNELDWCYTGYGISEQYKIQTLTLAVPGDPWYLGWRKFANQSNFSFSDGHVKTMPPGAMTDPARWVINPPANDTFSG